MATEGLAPNVDTGAWVGGRVVKLDLGIEELVKPVFSVRIGADRFEHCPHDLHVLLRHRPRSIPQAQESVLPVAPKVWGVQFDLRVRSGELSVTPAATGAAPEESLAGSVALRTGVPRFLSCKLPFQPLLRRDDVLRVLARHRPCSIRQRQGWGKGEGGGASRAFRGTAAPWPQG